MQRVNINRSDNLSDMEAAQKTMISAYTDNKGKLVVVAINYTADAQPLTLNFKNMGKFKKAKTYVTTAAPDDNMKATVLKNTKDAVTLPARSITTIILNS